MIDATAAVIAILPVIDPDALPRTNHLAKPSVVAEAALPPHGWQEYSDCVERRESNGHKDSVNRRTKAAGLFQFMPSWRHGLPYMVADRLARHGLSKAKAREVRKALAKMPIQKWPTLYQRIGFAEVIDRGGERHWFLVGSRCNGLAAR